MDKVKKQYQFNHLVSKESLARTTKCLDCVSSILSPLDRVTLFSLCLFFCRSKNQIPTTGGKFVWRNEVSLRVLAKYSKLPHSKFLEQLLYVLCCLGKKYTHHLNRIHWLQQQTLGLDEMYQKYIDEISAIIDFDGIDLYDIGNLVFSRRDRSLSCQIKTPSPKKRKQLIFLHGWTLFLLLRDFKNKKISQSKIQNSQKIKKENQDQKGKERENKNENENKEQNKNTIKEKNKNTNNDQNKKKWENLN